MTYHNAIAIAEERSRTGDNAVESSQHIVVGFGLDVYAGMPPPPSIRTDDVTSWQRIGPLIIAEIGEDESVAVGLAQYLSRFDQCFIGRFLLLFRFLFFFFLVF